METNNNIQYLTKPIGFSDSTSMDVYASYTASSGFNYFVGIREIKDIKIMEFIAEGTANTFLCGINIFSLKDNVLLDNVVMPKFTQYTRTKVMELVKKSICNLLEGTALKNNVTIDMAGAVKLLDDMLDDSYMGRSRSAILDWANNLGLVN